MKALTVKQAEAKICPMVRGPCFGDNCMWWKWAAQEFYRDVELWSKSRNMKVNSAFGDDAEWRPVEGAPNEPPPAVGHCVMVKSPVWSY